MQHLNKIQKKSDFLDVINNPHHRIAINKFRLGNHKLHIETGRYTIPKTPVDSRICSFCNSNEIENETHFIFSCKLYDSIRLKFFNAIAIKYNNFQNLDINSKTLFLCNNVDPDVCRSTSAFVFQATSLRHKVLFEKWRPWILYIYIYIYFFFFLIDIAIIYLLLLFSFSYFLFIFIISYTLNR